MATFNPAPTPMQSQSEARDHYLALLEQGQLQQAHQLLRNAIAQIGFPLLLHHFLQYRSDGFEALTQSLHEDFCQGRELDSVALEFLWLSLLQQADDARDACLAPVFQRLCFVLTAQDWHQSALNYGFFHTNQSDGLHFPHWLPVQDISAVHPALSQLYGAADIALLGQIHDVSLFNRLHQAKRGLKKQAGSGLWRIEAESRLESCVEIEISTFQVLQGLDSHWNATGSLAVTDFIKYFANKGFTIIPMQKHCFSPAPQHSNAAFYLTQHSYGALSGNRWHFKHAHISRHMQVDRHGYAGFSELAQTGIFRHANSMPQRSAQDICAMVSQLRQPYVGGALAKVPQPGTGLVIPGRCERVIFVTMQIATDRVMRLASFDNLDMVQFCIRHKRNNDLLIIKKHPRDPSARTAQFLAKAAQQHNVMVSDASIYTLFGLADLVVTCNSGTGFEALLFGKPVISCGRSDYQMATASANSEQRLAELLNAEVDAFPGIEARNRFVVNYCQEMYCVDRPAREKETWLDQTFIERQL